MDNKLDLTGLRTASETAGTDLTKLVSSVPGMLTDLKKSLVSIYSQDNPLIQARDTALGNYLSAGDKARAEFLPANQPQVAGSPLNYSPTQLQSMVSGRESAALAPLLGLNQAVTQGYGNIGDLVGAAGNTYANQVKAAELKATNAANLYKNAIDEYKAITERQNSGWGAGFFGGAGGAGGAGGGGDLTGLKNLVEPDQPQPGTVGAVGGGGNQINNAPATLTQVPSLPTPAYNNPSVSYGGTSQGSFWDNLLSLFGATPRYGEEQPVVQQNTPSAYDQASQIGNQLRRS